MKPTTIETRQINENEYRTLSTESFKVLAKLARCIDNKFVNELPEAINLVKEFINKLDGKHIQLMRRPLDVLHSVLITRMYYNRKFPSPLYTYDLDSLRLHARTEVEFRNLYAIYLVALEESLVQEA